MTATRTPEQVVTTPTVRHVVRASRFWIVAAVVVVLAVIGYNILTPPAVDGAPLSTDGTGQMGAGALVAVLTEHGVSVSPTTSLTATAGAAVSKESTTIFVYDPSDYLDADQRARLATLAAHVVVLSPTAGTRLSRSTCSAPPPISSGTCRRSQTLVRAATPSRSPRPPRTGSSHCSSLPCWYSSQQASGVGGGLGRWSSSGCR
jgi:hypothetical protein